jgi:hypothetical protein
LTHIDDEASATAIVKEAIDGVSEEFTVLEVTKILGVLAPVRAEDGLVDRTDITLSKECNCARSDCLDGLGAPIHLLNVYAW